MVLLRPLFVLYITKFTPCNKPLLQTGYYPYRTNFQDVTKVSRRNKIFV